MRKFWADTILSTLFIFSLMGLFASVTQFNIFDIFDPIGEALADFQLTDIVYSQLREPEAADERIILVNMGTKSRMEIGFMLNIINQYNPKVIGIDSFFYEPKEDTLGDMVLAEAIAAVENIVMVTKLVGYNEEINEFELLTTHPMFTWTADSAFANLITGASYQEDLKMCRTFTPQERVHGQDHMAFGVRLANYADPGLVDRFLARNKEFEVINYRGNVVDFGATHFGTKYYALDADQVLFEDFVPDIIEDKIVIFCYLGNYLGDVLSTEDKYFTPMNTKYAGRAKPDMFGGVIHANIVSMILNEDYVDKMSDLTNWIIGIVYCWINVVFFTFIYNKIPRWYDGATKLIQLAELLVLNAIVLYVFHLYNYELNLTIAIIAMLLSGDALEVYHGVVKNLFSREGRKELFAISKG